MSPPNEGGPLNKGRPHESAEQQAHRHLTDVEREGEQLTLWPTAKPEHRLDPAEADMRFWVNTQCRGRPHWWQTYIAERRSA